MARHLFHVLYVLIAIGCGGKGPTEASERRSCCTSDDQSEASADAGEDAGANESAEDSQPDASTSECDRSQGPSTSPLRRLSRVQLRNTYRDLSARMVGADLSDSLVEGVSAALDGMPLDSADDLRRLDHSVSQDHVAQQYYAARAFAAGLVAATEPLAAAAGDCAVNEDSADDADCIAGFVDEFGPLIFRRPLREEERSFLLEEVYGDPTTWSDEQLRALLVVMLTSPQFVYHLEVDGTAHEGADEITQISSFELANRLSYHFWQTMPDAALYAAAASGELESNAGFEAAVERVFSDARTQDTLDDFFEQWLELDHLPELDLPLGDPRFDAFVGEFEPTGQTRENMVRDVLDLTRYVVWESDGQIDDLLLNEDSFATTADVAEIYGGVALRVEGEAPRPLTSGDRPGILTRPAMVASGSAVSHPILKGVFIRRRILCDALGAPPADLGPLPEVPEGSSAREHAEILTEREGTSCAYCHRSINGLGFATENFDALGRARTEERVYGEEGELLSIRPVNTQSVPWTVDGDETISAGSHDLMRLLLESNKVEPCMARFWFRFSFARTEDLSLDACALEDLEDQLRSGSSLADALKSVALLPEFRLRRH